MERLLPKMFMRQKCLGMHYLLASVRSLRIGSKRNYHVTDHQEPFAPIPGKFPKWATSGKDALSFLKDGANIFIQGGAATPTILLNELYKYVIDNDLKDIKLYHIHTDGNYPFTQPEARDRFKSVSLFTGNNCREPINEGYADYTPIFLCEIPLLFRKKYVKLDAALINITPPDRHGFCSLGPSVDVTRAAIQNADNIIALVNPMLPVTLGEGNIHFSHLTVLINGSMPCHQLHHREATEVEDAIGKIIAENLVDDYATLQTGIGAIPDSVLSRLTKHRQLGVHTEMFSDGMVDLVKSGAVTNAYKKFRPGKLVSSFVIGTEKVFKFIHDNPMVDLADVAWVNSPLVVCQNPKPTAINSCIEVDLTGQVVSDSIGTKIYSGFGGQLDFLRGAAISTDGDGKPIIALPSTTKRGESKIVPNLKPGAGVVTTRAHVHYVVTEHGIAYLYGRNLRQRAHALIQIAHPDHREELEKGAFEKLKVMPSPD